MSRNSLTDLILHITSLVGLAAVLAAIGGYIAADYLAPENYTGTPSFATVYFLAGLMPNLVAAGIVFLLGYTYLRHHRERIAREQMDSAVVQPLKDFITAEVADLLKHDIKIDPKRTVGWAELLQGAMKITICVQGWDWLIRTHDQEFKAFFARGGCVEIFLPDTDDLEQMKYIASRLDPKPVEEAI